MAESSANQSGALAGTRKTSLIRGIGLVGSVALGLSAISLFASGLLPASTIASTWPGANLAGIIVFALVVCLLHTYTYAVIGCMAPKSGADYIISTRTLNAPLGFAASFTLVVFAAFAAGSILSSITQTVAPAFIQTAALITGNAALNDLTATITAPQVTIFIGTTLMVLIFASMLLPQKYFIRIVIVGVALGIIAWVILMFQLGTSPAEAFPPAWDRYFGPGNYGNVPLLADQQGMKINPDPGLFAMAGLLMSFWMFFGSFSPTFVAGEVKQPGRTLLTGSLLSLMISGGIFLVSTLLLQRLIPPAWLAAQAYLSQSSTYTGVGLPFITFYTAILQPNFPIVIIVAVAWVITLISLIQTILFFCGRIVLAWARDNMLPNIFTYLTPRIATPVLATLVVAAIAELGLVQAAQGLAINSQMNAIFSMLVCTAFPILAATVFPFRRPEWYAKCPPLVRHSIGRLPVITLVGVIVEIYLAWLIFNSIFGPGGINQVTSFNMIALVVVYFVGVLWFFMRTLYLRRHGIDVKTIYQNMPED